jgi:hypothetical protein
MRALLVALALSLAAPAAAAKKKPRTAADVFARLDPDAPAYFVVRPSAETALWAWLRKFEGAPAAVIEPMLANVAAAYTGVVGFDATQGWEPLGLEPSLPIAVAVPLLDDGAADRAWQALERGDRDPPRVLVGARAVAAVTDAAKLRKLIASLVKSGSLTAPAGAATALGKGAPAALGKLKVVAFTQLTERALLTVRVDADWLTIDVVALYGGLPLDWKQDRAAIEKFIAHQPPAGGAKARLTTGSGRALASAGFGATTDAVAWTRVLEHGARHIRLFGGQDRTACADQLAVARDGVLADFTTTLDFSAKAFTISVVYGVRRPAELAAAFPASDDAALDVNASDQLGAFVVYLSGLAGLRALPRPAELATGAKALSAGRACGVGDEPDDMGALESFAWPYLLALAAEEAAADAEWQPILDGVRNFGGVVLGLREDVWTSPSLVAFTTDPAAGAKVIAKNKDEFEAKPITIKGRKALLGKKDGPVHAILDDKLTTFVVPLDGVETFKKFVARARPKAAASPPLAALRIDGPKVLREVGRIFGLA